MKEIKYADAGMDMKKFVLVFLGKCRIVLAAAALGAALGGLLYLAAHIVPEAEREYRAVSKLYLDFAADETGEVYQAYNGYTWNDLMATEPILSVTMSYLPEGYTEEEVVQATKAEILSDLRLLTITVTTHDAERTNAITGATNRALEELGATAKEFIKIEAIQADDAALVTADSRLVQAVIVGAVIALFAALFGILLYYVLDDRIFVASDIRMVTDVPFLGYCFSGNEGFQQDYERNVSYVEKKEGRTEVLSLDAGEGQALPTIGERQENVGVILQIPYGKVHAAYLGYVIEILGTRNRKAVGVAIRDADKNFLRKYYGAAVKNML